MIVFTTEPKGDSTLMCLYGNLEPEDSVAILADHLRTLASSTQLVIDLSGLGAAGAASVTALSQHLPVARVHEQALHSTDLRTNAVAPLVARGPRRWMT